MKKILYPYIFLWLVIFSSCTKDKTQIDECDDLSETYNKPTLITVGQSYTKNDSIKFTYGTINPVNSDELVYWGGKFPDWYFYKYNMVTKERIKLTDLIPQNPPKWHRNGWVVFNAEDHNIYKVKPNGDSLTQLTYSGDCFMPEWNLSGDTIICNKAFYSIGIYFIKSDGSLITVNYGDHKLSFPSWAPFDSVVIYTKYDGLYKLNIFDSTFALLKESRNSALGACWFPDGKKILWCSDGKPMVLDYITKEQQPLLPECEKKRYMYPSISADGRYALLTMEIGGFVSLNLTQSKYRIVKVDLQTGEEELLDLPE